MGFEHIASIPTSVPTYTTASTTPAPDMLSQLPLTTIDPVSTTLIKMEDFQCSHSTASPSPMPSSQSSPPPESQNGKPVKKRKSWGQVLPEPKTNLPPRKRAKTEDEKEQRRIERVKRNRLAAHNSRERKRQEVELLQAEKDKLEQQLNEARNRMAVMAAQLKIYQERHPGELPDQQTLDLSISTSIENNSLHSDTICPRQASLPSPVSMADMDTPRDDSCLPETPSYSDSPFPESVTTRYPAAILCDLQCPKTDSRLRSTSFLAFQFQMSMAFLSAILSTLPLFTPTAKRSTTPPTTSPSSTSHPIPTAPRNRARRPRNPSSALRATRMTRSPILMAFLTSLMSDPSICRQTPAQQLLLATSLASQRRVSSVKWAARSDGWASRSAVESGGRRRSSALHRRARFSRRSSALEQDVKRSLHLISGHHTGSGSLVQGLGFTGRSVS